MQRVTRARVTVDGDTVGAVGHGILVLVGVGHEDGDAEARWLAEKVANLRIFSDDEGRMNRCLLETGGAALVVSQFTLLGDARRGRRPSFVRAAQGPEANAAYEGVVAGLRSLGVPCATGRFGATMEVELVNSGPVTILLDSAKTF